MLANGPEGSEGAPAAARRLLAALTGFVLFVSAVRFFRPAVLFEPDLSIWQIWLLMWAATLGLTALGALAASAAFRAFSRSRFATGPLAPLPFRPGTLVVLALGAIGIGALVRFADLGRPESLIADDVSLIGQTLGLHGTWSDFLRPLRAAPYGIPKPFATVGVLYLEVWRWSLRLFGTTLFGMRFVAALAASLSLVTGALLGRALLPRGGGTLVALVPTGLRWHLIMSRWSWAVAVVLIPLVDVATLLLLSARRRQRLSLAGAAGVVCGLGAHAYLASWVAGGALALWASLPEGGSGRGRRGVARAALFCAGFAVAAGPLFLQGAPGDPAYFARTKAHNVFAEMRYQRSAFPPFTAAADALASPWFVPEPTAWADLPGRSRLGWLLGTLLAVGLGRAFLAPLGDLGGLLLAHAAAGFLSSVVQGNSGNPNGYRYVYLTVPAALAVASGALALLSALPERARRMAAVLTLGGIAIAGTIGMRDGCLRWPEARSTFDQMNGCSTRLGAAAARWSLRGPTDIEGDPSFNGIVAEGVRRYAITSEPLAAPGGAPLTPSRYLVTARAEPGAGERIVERVADPWGRACGAVLRRADPGSGSR